MQAPEVTSGILAAGSWRGSVVLAAGSDVPKTSVCQDRLRTNTDEESWTKS
eukprot:COSAG06_NODE_67473_length_252_cov_0.307190_1_plen_50_part_01